jgi:hypothetical protein
MWKIRVPPRLHIFVLLLPNNKTLTRDNLAKRQQVDDATCLFCNEDEAVTHLFFSCCVAQCMWQVAKIWLRGKKYNVVNVFNTTILWII